MTPADKALIILGLPTLVAIGVVLVWLVYLFRKEIFTSPKPKTPAPKKQVRPCPRCKAEIRKVAKYCPKCGKAL